MTKRFFGSSMVFMIILVLFLIGGCGSSKKEAPPEPPLQSATNVGSSTCLQCHNASPDITGVLIGESWTINPHSTIGHVQCEDCHGPGSLHWGLGPIPFPNPQPEQCIACHPHTFTGFHETAHANAHIPGGFAGPDQFFFQGDAGPEQAMSSVRGGAIDHPDHLEFLPDGKTPIAKSQHIEECSVCHNPNQRFAYSTDAVLRKPDPNNMPNPVVTCGSCHDMHEIEQKITVATRTSPVSVQNFRKYFIDTTTGAQVSGGTPFNAFIFQPNGAVQSNGTVDATKVSGTNNELNVEGLCGVCHTVGKYKYEQTATHQLDIFSQWKVSAHGTRSDPAFAEFSANPTAYINPSTGTNYVVPRDTGHTSLWPYDMSLGSTTGGSGKPAATASTTTNAAFGGTNDNFPCYKCHNGLTSRDYQDDVQGTPDAHVVFGDEPVICVTCHDPHQNATGVTMNLRKPKVMSKYTSAQVTFAGNVFWDNTPVPDGTGNATICVYCHQGRESGFTLFKRKLASDTTLTGAAFFNPHYLGTAAMLWGKNGYEFPGKNYGVNTFHQQTNCFGCHMAPGNNTTVGGHTWKIVSDDDTIVNSATCNAASCHAGRVPTTNSGGEFDNFRDTTFDPTNDYDGNGTVEGIPVEIAGLEDRVIAILLANGIEYDDLNYPYFFVPGTDHTVSTNAFTSWTLPTYKAAFNLSFVIKGLPTQATSQIDQPNTSAATHNFRYNIELLHDSYEAVFNSMAAGSVPASEDIKIPGATPTTLTVTLPAPSAMVRPDGTRPATNYAPQPDGSFNPRQ